MGEKIVLKVQTRNEEGKKAKQLRRQGFLPAVVYGPNTKNKNLKVKAQDFLKVLDQAGENTLIDLIIDEAEPVKALVYGVQYDGVRDKIIHIDFYQVDMDKPLTTEIPLHFIGQSPAVQNLGGILIKNMDEIEIECLPKDLVNFIEVDLSALAEFGDTIRIKDIKFPDGIKPIAEAEEMVATVVRPAVEEKREETTEEEGEAKKTEEKGKDKEVKEARKGEGEEKDKKEEK